MRVRSARGHSSLLCRWQVDNHITPKFHLTNIELEVSKLENMVQEFIEGHRDVIRKTASKAMEGVTASLKKLSEKVTEQIKLRSRRLVEELASSDSDHANKLLPQLHWQLEEVQSRLLQVTHDDNLALVNERLLFDVHRRLEAHLAERQLSSSDAPPFC